MAVFPIGGDTVGIVKRSKSNTRDRLRQRLDAAPTVVAKSGCLFQVQSAAPERREGQDEGATVEREQARVFLPVDDDTQAIDSTDAIQFPYPDGRVYELAGDRVVQNDIHGRSDHVRLVVEWQGG